jgi:von Willebrand factor type A domain
MAADPRSASRAWMTSLVLHTALLFAGVVIAFWPARDRGPLAVPVIDTRSMPIGLVLLESVSPPTSAPSAQAPPATFPSAVVPTAALPAIPDANVRPAEYIAPPPPTGTESSSSSPPEIKPQQADPLPLGAITTFCGVPTVGNSVVFVIDRSASMGLGGRFERARREIAASLRRLPPDARFQVIAYHGSTELLAGHGLMLATMESVEASLAALDRLIPEGGTDHSKALRTALALQPDVICFLTDDDDLTPEQVRDITRLNRSKASIHALCFIEPFGDSSMPLLAKQNRGVFRVVRW